MYQGKCQGCGGYGEVDDINLCADCAEDLEKEDVSDEQIAIWAEQKEAGRLKKKRNRQQSLALLQEKGIAYVTLSEGAGHYRIQHFDFWPSTGKYLNRKTNKYNRGVFNLIKEIENARQ